MDKKLLILLLLLAFAGCVNDMPYTPRDTRPELVMNALIKAGCDSNEVWVGVSKPGCVDTLTGDASIHCHINGHMGVVATEMPGQQRLRRFVFSAPLDPGDELLLELLVEKKRDGQTESKKATATVLVPTAPELGGIDTLTVGDSASRQLEFRIKMTDKTPGADYYSLAITCTSEIELYREGVLLGTEQFVRRCPLDTGDDLILSEDGIAAANMDSMFDIRTPNYYGSFFDSQFDCASVTLRPKVDKWQLNSWYLTGFVPYDSCYVRPTLKVELSHIDVRHYYYLKALNSLEGGASDLVLEDVAIPSNVEGGIGFVGVSNSVSQEFSLPSYYGLVTYDDDPYDELP